MPSPPVPDIQDPISSAGCHGQAESSELCNARAGCHGQAESAELVRADRSGASDSLQSTPRNDLILRAARGEITERTPVWLMRQAGRFDPQYLRIRAECGLELEDLFRDPDLAAEITMLPIRLGVDAAILFQDILTPLTPMGAHFVFRPGPMLDDPIRTVGQIEALSVYDPVTELAFVPRSIELTLSALNGDIPLLGFAGAPLTLAAFLIEGQSPGGDVRNVQAMMRDEPASVHRLLDKLAIVTADYLRMKIDTGVHAVQLFESVGDLFTEAEYEAFAMPYQRRVMEALGETVPRILFVKEPQRMDLLAASGADVFSVGATLDLRDARSRLGRGVALQGNVDNLMLRDGSPEDIEQAVFDCIDAGRSRGHILNLNHGILKDTPFHNVVTFIEAARKYRSPFADSRSEGV
jgi:uroporphyrinogen decarboxylase